MFDTFSRFDAQTMLFFIRILAVVMMLFHVVFSYILVRQVRRMVHVIEAQISPVFITVAWIHFVASVSVFLWVLLFV